jgi:hypothetical protein
VSRNRVTISWEPPRDDGGANIIAYIIERRDKKRMTWIKVDIVKPTDLEYTIHNLIEGNEYLFRVYAENCEGISTPIESKAVLARRKPGQSTSLYFARPLYSLLETTVYVISQIRASENVPKFIFKLF